VSSEAIEIRRATPDDLPAIVALAARSLGWSGDDDEPFLRWKHLENPAGPSPMWVALSEDRIVGFRTFMRWRFARGDVSIAAVRAVDTATDPEFQGRGIFSRLTLHGLEELQTDVASFVFNTPNDKSRPGYLKMGWHIAGRLPVRVMPTSTGSLVRLRGARASASRTVLSSSAGEAPTDVFSDTPSISRLLERLPEDLRITTQRTPQYLAWRYGFTPLQYRVVLRTSSPDDGLAVFHRRQRGEAVEATVCDVLVPAGARGAESSLMKSVVAAADADYLLRIDRRAYVPRFAPVPRIGPVLTLRSISGAATPTLRDLSLSMGDVELF
jgi:hypothetical protein